MCKSLLKLRFLRVFPDLYKARQSSFGSHDVGLLLLFLCNICEWYKDKNIFCNLTHRFPDVQQPTFPLYCHFELLFVLVSSEVWTATLTPVCNTDICVLLCRLNSKLQSLLLCKVYKLYSCPLAWEYQHTHHMFL